MFFPIHKMGIFQDLTMRIVELDFFGLLNRNGSCVTQPVFVIANFPTILDKQIFGFKHFVKMNYKSVSIHLFVRNVSSAEC